jgi:ABC-type antimicrobial peptide transport system permease subunit
VLIGVGVFSVMAYSVSMRTREIGIRMALGAVPEHILGLVLGHGLSLVAIGVAIGLVASLALTRLIASQLWGVTATDPWTFAGMTALLLTSGLAACLFPALRAARVDPKIALRCE